jgi:Leucine-rich repeat (LRR) protein
LLLQSISPSLAFLRAAARSTDSHFVFNQVSALIASHNEIELLPRNMHLSYHLADVQLHCNQLVTLDPSLFASTSITSLRLDSNMITNLPDDVASASSLQVTAAPQ